MPWERDRELPDGHMVVDPLVLAQLSDQVGRRQCRPVLGPAALTERTFSPWLRLGRDKPSAN